jgi:hypothetical protein
MMFDPVMAGILYVLFGSFGRCKSEEGVRWQDDRVFITNRDDDLSLGSKVYRRLDERSGAGSVE